MDQRGRCVADCVLGAAAAGYAAVSICLRRSRLHGQRGSWRMGTASAARNGHNAEAWGKWRHPHACTQNVGV